MPGGQTLKMAVLGTTGSGKTTLVIECIGQYDRVLILDTMGEYDEIPNCIVREGSQACIETLLELEYKPNWVLCCLTLTEQEGLDILGVAFDVENILIVVDESSVYTSPNFLPDEFARLIRYGRKRNIDLIFIARRPAEIHRELTAQANVLVTFQQFEPIDIRYLRTRMGDKAERAPNLKPFHILVHGDMKQAPLAVLRRMGPENDVDST
jgi:DNA helicase HerA-like ATPase